MVVHGAECTLCLYHNICLLTSDPFLVVRFKILRIELTFLHFHFLFLALLLVIIHIYDALFLCIWFFTLNVTNIIVVIIFVDVIFVGKSTVVSNNL